MPVGLCEEDWHVYLTIPVRGCGLCTYRHPSEEVWPVCLSV